MIQSASAIRGMNLLVDPAGDTEKIFPNNQARQVMNVRVSTINWTMTVFDQVKGKPWSFTGSKIFLLEYYEKHHTTFYRFPIYICSILSKSTTRVSLNTVASYHWKQNVTIALNEVGLGMINVF